MTHIIQIHTTMKQQNVQSRTVVNYVPSWRWYRMRKIEQQFKTRTDRRREAVIRHVVQLSLPF